MSTCERAQPCVPALSVQFLPSASFRFNLVAYCDCEAPHRKTLVLGLLLALVCRVSIPNHLLMAPGFGLAWLTGLSCKPESCEQPRLTESTRLGMEDSCRASVGAESHS